MSLSKKTAHTIAIIAGLLLIIVIYYKKALTAHSFAQNGEDLVVREIVTHILKKKQINYLDIGAYDGEEISNTKLFYNSGSTGVLIEPNPDFFNEIKRNRNRDICLNIGIGTTSKKYVDFYVINFPMLSTFSKQEADRISKIYCHSIVKVVKVEIVNINEIMEKFFKNGLDFLSIDVEGLDSDILKTINFKKFKPKIICVETVHYISNKKSNEQYKNDIVNFLTNNGYGVYYSNAVNTIFIDSNL